MYYLVTDSMFYGFHKLRNEELFQMKIWHFLINGSKLTCI